MLSLSGTVKTLAFTQGDGESLEGFEQKGDFSVITPAAMLRTDIKRQE